MPRLIKRGCGPLMNTVSISLKLLLPLINMQCSMKEHRRRPADTIFIVGRGARQGGRRTWEEGGEEGSEERYISLEWSGGVRGAEVGREDEQRQMRRRWEGGEG